MQNRSLMCSVSGAQAAAGHEEVQRMARNLTVAVAPDDFKAADQLEPQVMKQPPSFPLHARKMWSSVCPWWACTGETLATLPAWRHSAAACSVTGILYFPVATLTEVFPVEVRTPNMLCLAYGSACQQCIKCARCWPGLPGARHHGLRPGQRRDGGGRRRAPWGSACASWCATAPARSRTCAATRSRSSGASCRCATAEVDPAAGTHGTCCHATGRVVQRDMAVALVGLMRV